MIGYIGTELEMVTNETGKFAKKPEERLLHHVKFEAIKLLDNSELGQRLSPCPVYLAGSTLGFAWLYRRTVYTVYGPAIPNWISWSANLF